MSVFLGAVDSLLEHKRACCEAWGLIWHGAFDTLESLADPELATRRFARYVENVRDGG